MTKILKSHLIKFISELTSIDKDKQSEALFKFYYYGGNIEHFPTPATGGPSAAPASTPSIPSAAPPTAAVEPIYPIEKLDPERQEYIQNVIFGLENILKKGLRGAMYEEKRKAVENAIYVFQRLNDMSLWDRFQRTFFTGETDHLGNKPDKNSYQKATEISVTNVPNIMVLRKFDDNGNLTNELEKKPLTNLVIQAREIFENPMDRILHAMYTANERFNLWSILASNMTPENKKILKELDKKRTTRKVKFASQHPHFYEKQLLKEYKDDLDLDRLAQLYAGGKKSKKHTTRKNRKK